MEATPDLTSRREAMAAVRSALAGVESVLWQATGSELGPLLREIDDLGRLVEAARVAVVGEAMSRGEMRSDLVTTSSSPDPGSPAGSDQSAAEDPTRAVAGGVAGVGWVREWAPSLGAGGAGQLVRLVERLRSHDHAQLREAVMSGTVGVGNATVCVREMDRLEPRLQPEAVSSVWSALLDLAAAFGPREIRAVRPRLLAEYGAEGELQADQDLAARRAALSQPHDQGDGTFDYVLRLDVEGKTVLEAALGPLAAPRPADGIPDLRGSDRRRADALVELTRRAVSCPEGTPQLAKAQLFLTVDIDDLRNEVKAGTTIGGADAGTVLAPQTIRRIACDAGLLPTVMAGPGQVLDLGTTTRCFTSAQTKALWLRDHTCRIPGCGMPAQWCEAHHLVHWGDGGRTDLDNGVLLCGYHHRWVHDRRLMGHLTRNGRVVWDLTPGSYDTRRR